MTHAPGDKHPPVRGDDSVAEAAQKVFAFHLHHVTANETGVRAGDADALHDMRVATRRLRSALRLFRKPAGKARTRPFQDEWKWLGRELGAVRDLDVSLAYFAAQRGEADAALRAALDAAMESQERARRRARERLLRGLDSDRYARLIEDFAAFAAALVDFADGPKARERLAEFAPRALRKRLRRVRRYRRRLSLGDSAQLHALRIECKHLRYAAEFVQNAYPKRLGRWIRDIVRVQDALGAIHDADVREEALRAFAAARGDDPALAEGLARLAQREQDRRAEQLQQFLLDWRRLTRRKFVRRLESILARPR